MKLIASFLKENVYAFKMYLSFLIYIFNLHLYIFLSEIDLESREFIHA